MSVADDPGVGASERPLVKICGVMRVEDARAAVTAGASFVGAILSPGFGRSVEPERAAAFLGERPAPGAGPVPVLVAVLVDPEPEQAIQAARRAGAGVVQLHGAEAPEVVRAVAAAGPWGVWKAVRARDPGEAARAVERYGELVDGLLLDGGRGEERGGGRGIPFARNAAAALRTEMPPGIQLILAGGLKPGNVERAVRRFRPDVVDVSSGVESRTGHKDAGHIVAFVQAVRNAGRGQGS